MTGTFGFGPISLIYDQKSHILYPPTDKNVESAELNHHIIKVLRFDNEDLNQSDIKINEIKKHNGEAFEIEFETPSGKKRALVEMDSLREWFAGEKDTDQLQERLKNTIFKVDAILASTPSITRLKFALESAKERVRTRLEKSGEHDFSPTNVSFKAILREVDQYLDLAESSNLVQVQAGLDQILEKIDSLEEYDEMWNSGLPMPAREILRFAKDYSDSGELLTAARDFAADIENTSANQLLIQFASQTSGMRPSQLSVKKSGAGLTTGASDNPVYLIYDNDSRELVCVIKVFDEYACADEVNALRAMKAGGPANCNFPELMGIGKYRAQKNWNRVFVAQSPAPGNNLDKEITEVRDLKGEKRSLSFENLKQTMELTAEALAGLHETQPPSLKKPDDQAFYGYTAFLKKMAKQRMQGFRFTESPSQLAERFSRWSDKVTFVSQGSLTHGDFHPGNIFIDRSGIGRTGSKVTVIDNGMICESIREDNTMIGIAGKDAALFSLWLPIIGSAALTDQELEQLQEVFLKTYISLRSGLDSNTLKEEISYMQACLALDLVQKLSQIITDPSHPWFQAVGEDRLKQITAYLVEVLDKTVPK